MSDRLEGGNDAGAVLVDGTVRRPERPWSPTVRHLLRHLHEAQFAGAPEPLGLDDQGRQILTYIPGETVGNALPWPPWTHSDAALDDVAQWLRVYHRAVADFVPSSDAVWREGETWQPGMIVGHGDPAPYNAVWDGRHVVGFFDWDMAAPATLEDDVASVAFAWTPLHARQWVTREGFVDFDQRRGRLERFLSGYRWSGTVGDLIEQVDRFIQRRIETTRATAATGDTTYQSMLDNELDLMFESAREDLASL